MITWQNKIDIISETMDKAGCALSEDQRLVLIGCLCGLEISEPQEIEQPDYDRGWEAYHEGLGISDAYGDCLDGTKASMLEWHRGYVAAMEKDKK